MTTFGLISHTSLVHARDLYPLAQAVELGARDCARAWGLEPPAVTVFDRSQGLPAPVVPILFVDGTEDSGELAHHYWDPLRAGAAARVFVSNGSGFREGPFSLSESTSHEVLEALVNPHVNLWADMPKRAGLEVALEVCDPVQDSYMVSNGGAFWPVANFVTPAWFRPLRNVDAATVARAGLGFDFRRTLGFPGEVGREGYVVLRERIGSQSRVWTEAFSGDPLLLEGERLKAKSHALARSIALGATY